MGRSKQNKTQKKDGQHRAETRQEREDRLQQQAEAREACFKLLPYAAGIIVAFIIIFTIYVRNVPPKVKTIPVNNQQQFMEDMTQDFAAPTDGDGVGAAAEGEPVDTKPEGDASQSEGPPGQDEHQQDEETVEL